MSFEWLSLISAEIVAHNFSLEFPISEIRDVVAYIAILVVIFKRSK